jgi:hypothetical protein
MKIILIGSIEEEEYEEFFNPMESPKRSPSSNYHTNAMEDLIEHFANNFNFHTIKNNKSKK